MEAGFYILAMIVGVSGVCAMSFRNLVHCALAAAVAFAGLAGLYLQLGAQFVGLAQILVYVGAVAILIVFAILLTSSKDRAQVRLTSPAWIMGIAGAGLVWIILTISVLTHKGAAAREAVELNVMQIGETLMGRYVLALEAIAVLLTAALIGAVILAREEKGGER